MNLTSSPLRDRSARRVGVLAIRAPQRGLEARIQFLVEEALRLTTLPFEQEGRVYFFRRLRVPAFHLSSQPAAWIAGCSSALLNQAADAVHGAEQGAHLAHAVYFETPDAACSVFLKHLLRTSARADDSSASTGPASDWFWPVATGVPAALPRPSRIQLLIENWRAQPAGWAAVASHVVPELLAGEVMTLLSLVAREQAQHWLSDLSPGRRAPSEPRIRRTSGIAVLRTVVHSFDPGDPRVVWIAMLALLAENPALPQTHALAEAAAAIVASIAGVAVNTSGRNLSMTSTDEAIPVSSIAPATPPVIQPGKTEHRPNRLIGFRKTGESTNAAGLYFLLWPLRHLGFADTDAQQPDLAARVMLRLALAARVDPEDPVLSPLLDLQPASSPSDALDERIWAFKARRWCWRTTGMTSPRIVTRRGRITWAAPDLDITLPLDEADLGIRKWGLDLDPGWVPWFGRVVRFHYEDQRSFQ